MYNGVCLDGPSGAQDDRTAVGSICLNVGWSHELNLTHIDKRVETVRAWYPLIVRSDTPEWRACIT